MGVINVTPDSFSDGGVHLRVESAVTAAWGMLDAGAAIVDVGGESTRPGSAGVTAEEELHRIEPVLNDLSGAPVSVDTSKAAVARRALELGVELVNDVTALRGDPELAGVREELVCLDPGIGFGKTAEHNFELVGRLDELAAIGRPLLVGFSRKSSLGKVTGAKIGSTAASVGAAVSAFDHGASILRVHDVREHVDALAVAKAVRG